MLEKHRSNYNLDYYNHDYSRTVFLFLQVSCGKRKNFTKVPMKNAIIIQKFL